ncbi:lysylphosphatidylglycerol synthase transmembrane domain-containing protein [Poriferisphaera sp. WC338]|uniref:lysylphosphatidylglycerol synthase transmembrane domain-containing protein n=1 Tax=Poriferisphaera sp. WC338 TaxID=3425129 RepID=UPI003D812AF7
MSEPGTGQSKPRKYISIIARLLIAVVGIGYIAWSLTWTDSILVPAGQLVQDGSPNTKAILLPIESESETSYLVALPSTKHTQFVDLSNNTIPKSLLGDQPDQFQYRQGIVSTLREANYTKLAIGFLLIGLIFPMQAMRWWLLLTCRGLAVSKRKAYRLTMVGLFFNFCMPGMTGGDVVKAYYAAKGSGSRSTAIMSVALDRVAGLFGLILLAGIVGLWMLDHDLARKITIIIWLGIGAIVIGGCIYFSGRTRKALGVAWLMGKMSQDNPLNKIDQAAVAYRHHKWTVLAAIAISLPVHLAQVGAVSLAGYALGMQTNLGLMFVVLPLIFLAGSMPISYQGLGVMEGLGIAFLAIGDVATNNQVVGMLLLMRIFFVIYALCSSIFVLRGNIHLFPQIPATENVPSAE